jgi:pimeloyl-ACP methyl ester carboxylesterase
MIKSIQVSNKKIQYNIIGNGPPLVFIHGFTEHPGIWNSFADQLSSDYRVIIPALPAHGGSEYTDDLTMDFMADCMYEILNSENISEATFFGHSMGGYAMLNLASRYPQLCKGICLFHSSATADSEEIKKNRERTIEIIRNNHGQFLHQFIPDLFAENHREKLEPEIQSLIQEASKIQPEGLIACMNAMKNRRSHLDVLTEIHCPVGFIIGKQDSRIIFQSILAQTALPNESHVLILQDCGHMGYLEKPGETLDFIRYFAGKSF